MTVLGRLFAISALLLAVACGSSSPPEVEASPETIALDAAPLIWPGDSVRYDYVGKSLDLEITGSDGGWLTVRVGDAETALQLKEGTHTYPVHTSDTETRAEVIVQKRSGVFTGPSEVSSATVLGRLEAAPAAQRSLLVIGDSISTGFGVDGSEAGCEPTPETTNFSHSYAAVLADKLNADVTSVSIDGRGLIRNYSDGDATTMAELYQGSALSTGETWPELPTDPDIVIIHLGTTDFYLNDPGEAFAATYEELMASLRKRYPGTYVYAALGPMLGPEDRVLAEAAIQSAVDARISDGDARVGFVRLDTAPDSAQPWACAWNPSIDSHAHMASQFQSRIVEDIGG